MLTIVGYLIFTVGWLWVAYEMFTESKMLGFLALFAFPAAFIISILPNSINISNTPFLIMLFGLFVIFTGMSLRETS